MLKNEKIKAKEVHLTGMDGEDLGVVSIKEALTLAKTYKVDLVCTSIMSSPPPCQLIRAHELKEATQQAKKAAKPVKVKEIRLTTAIEPHDMDTKMLQAERILKAGNAVEFVVKLQGKEGPKAKALLEQLAADLKPYGTKQTGIQMNNKQVMVQLYPVNH